MSLSIPRRIRWCTASAMSRCATSSASSNTTVRTPIRCAAWRRRTPGAARRPGAACATSSIAASTPMPGDGACSTACCRMSPGAGRKWLNHRFASPIVSGGQQYEDHFNIADSFPFSYAWSTDHLTGKQDAILKRPDTDPLVFHTQTATEYWVRRGSLAHTDTAGQRPAAAGHGARLLLGEFAALRRSAAEGAVARARAEFLQRRVHVDVLPRQPRRDGSLGDGRHAAAAKPHPDARRRHAGEHRGMAAAVPRHSRRRHADARPTCCRCWISVPMRNAASCASRRSPCLAATRPTRRASNTRCWSRRWIATATTCPACARRWWQHHSAPIPAGICARAATATARNCASRAATSRSRSHRRNGRSPAIPGARSWSAIPTKRPMSRRSLAAARELVAQGLMLEEDVARCADAAADWGRPRHDVSLE